MSPPHACMPACLTHLLRDSLLTDCLPSGAPTCLPADELEGGGTREGGGMRRNASVFFHGSTAEEGDDYADKFGHYK